MSEIIAIANQKGGVAKTITTHNIAVGLAMRGKKVLMVDLDSQASLTISAGMEPSDTADNSIVSVLTDEPGRKRDIRECIHPVEVGEKGQFPQEYCYIIPSIIDLADLEWKMFARVSRELILSRALEPIKADYDYIVIDCPPQLSILTINALSCANGVIIPVKTDYLSYRGLTHLNDTIASIQTLTNPGLKVYGVVATFYESRTKNGTAILMELNREYNLIGVIPKTVLPAQGVYKGLSVVELAPKHKMAHAYMDIVDMIISGKYERKGDINDVEK
jgi:chromosome partitioning protein